MGSLTAFVIYAVALYLGYTSVGIIPIAVGISLISVWGSFYNSDKIVLTMTGAKVIDHDTAPQLFNLVHEITIASGMPMPKVAIVEDDAPNAFATGRDPEHAVARAAPARAGVGRRAVRPARARAQAVAGGRRVPGLRQPRAAGDRGRPHGAG